MRLFRIAAQSLVALMVTANFMAVDVGGQEKTATEPTAHKEVQPTRIAYPNKTWAIEIKLPGFVSQGVRTRQDGKGAQLMAANQGINVIVTVTLEVADKPGDATVCREFYVAKLAKAPLIFEDISTKELNDVALRRHSVTVPQTDLKQRNLNAYLVHDGIWIDVHLSKTPGSADDDQLFDAILKTIRFKTGINAETVNNPPINKLFAQGSTAFLKGDYKNAIGPYSEVLDLEKVNRELDEVLWRVLVDNLGMAYGITGDFENARATLEYGIQEDSIPKFSL